MSDRRRAPRIPQTLEAQCRLSGDLGGGWSDTMVVNISQSGVRLRGRAMFEPESVVELRVRFAAAKEPLLVKGRVAWSQLQASQVVEHGIEFLELTPDQQVQLVETIEFLTRKSIPPRAAEERRKFPRASELIEVQCHPVGDMLESWYPATVQNISATGVHMQSEARFREGTRIELTFSHSGLRAPMTLQGEVTRSQALANNRMDYGIVFVEISGEQQLQIDQMVGFLRKKGA